MVDGFSIDPRGVYDEAALSTALGVGTESLVRARQSGELRHTRKGRRILYLGAWVLEWLESDAKGVNDAK